MGKLGTTEILLIIGPFVLVAIAVLFIVLRLAHKPRTTTSSMTNQGQNRLEAIILTIDPNNAPDAIDPDAPRTVQNIQHRAIPPMNPVHSGVPPKNWLIESILVTVLCCLPFGIAGIVNAANVNSRYTSGDLAGAESASKAAKQWTSIGFFIGIGVVALWLIWSVIAGVSLSRYF